MSDRPKALLLYSGGFDSTVLLHELVNQGYDVTAMFFDYGQRSVTVEREKFLYWTQKLKTEKYALTIPRINWSSSATMRGDWNNENEYVEARNLIFLSYAISYAEAKKIPEIYVGFIGLTYYSDTSPKFVKMMDLIAEEVSQVDVKAPFVHWGKDDVFDHAEFNLDLDMQNLLKHTFSCNKPKLFKPCGECPDCLARKQYQERIDASNM